jgi:hypothetical protein
VAQAASGDFGSPQHTAGAGQAVAIIIIIIIIAQAGSGSWDVGEVQTDHKRQKKSLHLHRTATLLRPHLHRVDARVVEGSGVQHPVTPRGRVAWAVAIAAGVGGRGSHAVPLAGDLACYGEVGGGVG